MHNRFQVCGINDLTQGSAKSRRAYDIEVVASQLIFSAHVTKSGIFIRLTADGLAQKGQRNTEVRKNWSQEATLWPLDEGSCQPQTTKKILNQ